MIEKIRRSIEKSLLEEGFIIDEITYEKQNLNIVLDSEEVIDLNRIVDATRIINKILDEEDFIKDKYMLDVSSKEKGEVK